MVIGRIEEKNASKYFVFDSTDENKGVLKKKEGEYGKGFMKIKFNSDDDFPLKKQLKFPTMTTVVRSVFDEDWSWSW